MFRRVVIVVALVGLSACSGDSGTAAPTTTSTTTTSTTTSTSTTTTTVPLAPAASAQEAATTFVNAWRAGDRQLALTVALPAAVDAVFAAGEPGAPQNRGCNRPPADTPVLCVYKTAVGELQVRAAPGPGGWIVDQAIVSAD